MPDFTVLVLKEELSLTGEKPAPVDGPAKRNVFRFTYLFFKGLRINLSFCKIRNISHFISKRQSYIALHNKGNVSIRAPVIDALC